MAQAVDKLHRQDVQARFSALNPQERHAHVAGARAALYTACDELHRTGSLASPTAIVSAALAVPRTPPGQVVLMLPACAS